MVNHVNFIIVTIIINFEEVTDLYFMVAFINLIISIIINITLGLLQINMGLGDNDNKDWNIKVVTNETDNWITILMLPFFEIAI